MEGLGPFQRLIERHRAEWQEVQRVRCPTCPNRQAPVARSCSYLGAGPDTEGGVPVCKWHSELEREQAVAARVAARRERLERAGYRDRPIIDLIATATQPPRPAHRERTSPEFDRMWGAVTSFIEHPGMCLTLFGPPGCGKSFACAWIVASCASSFLLNPRACLVPTPEWNLPRRMSLTCGMLVIEDLGWEQGSDWHIGELQGIIMARADMNRPTVLSTNLAPVALQQRYGSAVWSRLNGDYRGSVMVFAGEDDLRQTEEP